MTHALDEPVALSPKLSAEIFVIPLEEGQYIVYAPLRRAAFVANARMVNLIADLQAGRTDLPADDPVLALLRRLEMVDAGPEPPPVTTFAGAPEPVSLTLFLTTACNLRCTYCYASAGDTPLAFMSLATAERGIDYVLTNAVRKGVPDIDIAYHGGGEPTMNWRVLTRSLAYAREQAAPHGIAVHAAAATNGWLRNPQIDWVIANLEGVSLSFDGLPEVQDRHRPTARGDGSSERVMHTLRRFDAAGYNYGIRVTVTADQIPLLADSLSFIAGSFRPQRIQVEPAYQLGRWKDAPTAETEEFIAAYRAAQERAAAFGVEITYSAARLGTLTNHFCGVTQDTFALSAEGNVSSCYEVFAEDNPLAPVFFYGKPAAGSRGYTFDLPVLDNLRNQAVQHREFCQGCFAKWTCAGDCYHKALTVSPDGSFAGSDRCHITRELTKDQILEKIARSGGLFWHEGPYTSAETASAGKELLW